MGALPLLTRNQILMWFGLGAPLALLSVGETAGEERGEEGVGGRCGAAVGLVRAAFVAAPVARAAAPALALGPGPAAWGTGCASGAWRGSRLDRVRFV